MQDLKNGQRLGHLPAAKCKETDSFSNRTALMAMGVPVEGFQNRNFMLHVQITLLRNSGQTRESFYWKIIDFHHQ